MSKRRIHDSWFDRMEAWLPICAAAETPDDEIDCLRFIDTHLRIAPDAATVFFGPPPANANIDLLFRVGAIESAAALLLDQAPYGFMLSRAASGDVVCTVVIPGSEEETIFYGASEAIVRVAAVLKAFLKIARRDLVPPVIPPRARHH